MEDQSAKGSRYIDDVPGLAWWTCVIAKFEPACFAVRPATLLHTRHQLSSVCNSVCTFVFFLPLRSGGNYY